MKRKFCVVLMLLAVICFTASLANAGFIVDIKAAPGQPGVSADGKSISADPGQVLLMQVWATVSGNGVADDSLTTITGGIGLTGAGALALDTTTNPFGYVAPFAESSAQVSATPTLLGLGGSTASTGPFFWRAAAAQNDTVDPQSWLMGTFKYTAGASAGTINYLKPGAALANLTFKFDNVLKNGNATSGLAVLSAGQDVVVAPVPEPATLVLLGMGALALVFIRRRK